ncbi:unnamed protein product, partial [Prorocentrum cordatum]
MLNTRQNVMNEIGKMFKPKREEQAGLRQGGLALLLSTKSFPSHTIRHVTSPKGMEGRLGAVRCRGKVIDMTFVV